MSLREDVTSLLVDHGCGTSDQCSMTADAAIAIVLERAAAACEAEKQDFLSESYATGQPLSSFRERFACDQCAKAIRQLAEETGNE